jgi:Ca2+-binding RTX toxin-like protein
MTTSLQGLGNDTLDGGAGDDYLDGGPDDDVYLQSQGVDFIYDIGGEADELRMAAGVDSAQVERSRIADDLYLQQLGSSDLVIIGQWFSDPSYQLEQIVFENGVIWTPATASILRRVGTEGDDVLGGSPYDDVIEGRGGNDTLYASEGNDILDGGSGDDVMWGDVGDDVYIPGQGVDSVLDIGGDDEIRMADEIVADDVERYRIGSDLHLQQLGATDSVTILNWFDDPSLQIERVLFADGAIWDAAMTGSLLRLGTADDDLVVGNQYDETLEGRTGNDTLDGGNGNDTMIGGAGDDTYIVENVDDIVVRTQMKGATAFKAQSHTR